MNYGVTQLFKAKRFGDRSLPGGTRNRTTLQRDADLGQPTSLLTHNILDRLSPKPRYVFGALKHFQAGHGGINLVIGV